jgi:hypothetical protein
MSEPTIALMFTFWDSVAGIYPVYLGKSLILPIVSATL